MANSSSAKGNPASTRMGNAALKSRRAASWARGEKRKAARREAQHKREVANVQLRLAGSFTAWEWSKATRAAKRKVARKLATR